MILNNSFPLIRGSFHALLNRDCAGGGAGGWGWLKAPTFFLGTKKGHNVNVGILNDQLRIFKENLPV